MFWCLIQTILLPLLSWPGVFGLLISTCCCGGCFYLVNCLDDADVIVTNTDVSGYDVVKVNGESKCRKVSPAPDCTGAVAVTVNDSFTNCAECDPVVCGTCITGTAPKYFLVEISGILAGGSGDCD